MIDLEPKVSIVIPAYKASKYLAQAIDSALAQTYSNIEVIVVNDGSPDDGATREVALSYGDKIRYFEKENGGSSSALNRGIQEMTGEWFSWLSHDDLYLPDKVKEQVAFMQSLALSEDQLERHVFFTASELINAERQVIQRSKAAKNQEIHQLLETLEGNERLVAESIDFLFHGCSCLVHRRAFEDIGGFDENLRIVNDIDYWIRLYMANYKIHFIPKVLVYGRVHAEQVSRNIGYSYHNPEQDMFWRRSLEWLKSNAGDQYELFYVFGRSAFRKTRNAEGKEAFRIAGELKPSRKWKLFAEKQYFKLYAKLRSVAKRVYVFFRAN